MIKKMLLIIAGFATLILGMVGIVLPLIPTTPLVLLAAICFSASNKSLESRLLRNRIFGEFIENYKTGQGISKRRKVWSIIYLWCGLVTSMVILRSARIYIVLSIVGVCVTVHLLMIRTKPKKR
jgi:hypothetical protein